MDSYDKTSIQINRCKRILALVDSYVEQQTGASRTELRKALMAEFEAPAIAQPVAAGSVKLMRLRESDHCMEPDEDGDLVRYENAIAWGVQQWEAALAEQESVFRALIKKKDDDINMFVQRAEKAEARALRAEDKSASANNMLMILSEGLKNAEARVKELQEALDVAMMVVSLHAQ